MRKRTQEERILDMIKRPVPRKRVGIVHLEMVRESRTLYGMKPGKRRRWYVPYVKRQTGRWCWYFP